MQAGIRVARLALGLWVSGVGVFGATLSLGGPAGSGPTVDFRAVTGASGVSGSGTTTLAAPAANFSRPASLSISAPATCGGLSCAGGSGFTSTEISLGGASIGDPLVNLPGQSVYVRNTLIFTSTGDSGSSLSQDRLRGAFEQIRLEPIGIGVQAPEPGTMFLIGAGLVMIAFGVRRYSGTPANQ